jgi:hypothetical protein
MIEGDVTGYIEDELLHSSAILSTASHPGNRERCNRMEDELISSAILSTALILMID